MNIKYPMKEKPKRGRPAIGQGPEANKVLKLYAEGFSIREVGAVLKMDPGAVRPSHLDYYLDEFTFRFNRRTSRSRGKLFYRLVQQATAIDLVPAKLIIGGRPEV